MMAPLADVRPEREEETVVVVLTGDVDISNAASVRLQIAEFVTPEDVAVIVDLSELSFIDSAGIHAFVELGTMLDERRQQLLLCVRQGSVIERAIEIIGLPRVVSVHSDRGEAMEAVRTSGSESRPVSPTDNA